MERSDEQLRDRGLLLDILSGVLDELNGRTLVADYLAAHPLNEPYYLVAVGKAAWTMANGALVGAGESLIQGLVITKHEHSEPCDDPRLQVLEAGHPVPDAASLAAGQALLDFIDHAEPGRPFLFLISGGTSSLVEVLPPGLNLLTFAAVNDWLLASGLNIHDMNRVRKGISAIKGGRLANHLQGRRVINLLLSDVPGDEPHVVGSGLLVPGEADCHSMKLPDWIRELTELPPPVPHVGDPLFDAIETHIVATNDTAMAVASRLAEEAGLKVIEGSTQFTGDAIYLGQRFADEVMAGPPGFYVWGGESTINLPSDPGRGGRSQALALSAARRLQGHDNVVLMAVGTDGTDGPTEDAGAMVDGATVEQGLLGGLDAEESLRLADAGSYLEESADLITTGPTGTNVMDLVMAIKR